MSNEAGTQRERAINIAQWEAEIKKLKFKLRAAKPLEKLALYDEIKALQAKISLARAQGESAQGSSRQSS